MPPRQPPPREISLSRRSFLSAAGATAGAVALPWRSSQAPLGSESDALTYEPTWASLDSHPLPAWYDDAKFGISFHWGIYSVPAWAPVGQYAEWYPYYMYQAGSPTYEYHRRVYGANFDYRDFIPMWKAEKWDPERWADLFHRAGARYIMPVGEHHDGFPLWNASTTTWNATTMGPKRPILKELETAMRACGMRFGPSYHGLYNYYVPQYNGPHPDYLTEAYVQNWMLPQIRELIENFENDFLYLDGDWIAPAEKYHTQDLVAWYYNRAQKQGKTVAVNDRLGQVRSEHGDYYVKEYDYNANQGISHKWENARGTGYSFGFNQNEQPQDYISLDDLIALFVDSVAHWGNVLLNVGPRADGTISDIQTNLLIGMGRWLDVNGEGIYGTTYWRVQQSTTGEGLDLRYTTKNGGNDLYAFIIGQPTSTVTLSEGELPQLNQGDQVRLLGHAGALRWSQGGGRVVVQMPSGGLPDEPVHTLHFAIRRDAAAGG